MSFRALKLLALVSLIVVVSAESGWAQYGLESQLPVLEASVSGNGTVVIHAKPTVMLVHVQLLGIGKDLPEALDHLKKRREAARGQLATLGAEKDSIVFGEPTLSDTVSENRNQMERMIRERLLAAGREPKGLKLPATATVSCPMKAEWKLPSEDTEKLLLDIKTLQEKITKADLGGAALAKELSPEQQELLEESVPDPFDSDDEGPPPGTPQFIFMARVGEQAHQDALAKAFAKARTKAARLAAAAGAELGPLIRLDGDSDMLDSYGGMYYDYGYDPYGNPRQMPQLIANQLAKEEEGRATVSFNPDELSFTFRVGATFTIKQK